MNSLDPCHINNKYTNYNHLEHLPEDVFINIFHKICVNLNFKNIFLEFGLTSKKMQKICWDTEAWKEILDRHFPSLYNFRSQKIISKKFIQIAYNEIKINTIFTNKIRTQKWKEIIVNTSNKLNNKNYYISNCVYYKKNGIIFVCGIEDYYHNSKHLYLDKSINILMDNNDKIYFDGHIKIKDRFFFDQNINKKKELNFLHTNDDCIYSNGFFVRFNDEDNNYITDIWDKDKINKIPFDFYNHKIPYYAGICIFASNNLILITQQNDKLILLDLNGGVMTHFELTNIQIQHMCVAENTLILVDAKKSKKNFNYPIIFSFNLYSFEMISEIILTTPMEWIDNLSWIDGKLFIVGEKFTVLDFN
ncbi:MAG: hypothetical protein H0V82_02960 [Candidatus Protochlamydia sp.]|nr:hypothetical protein [Candidatus Protochlamydia sp.]